MKKQIETRQVAVVDQSQLQQPSPEGKKIDMRTKEGRELKKAGISLRQIDEGHQAPPPPPPPPPPPLQEGGDRALTPSKRRRGAGGTLVALP